MHFRTPAPVLLSGVVALSFFTGACATKKHVREQIAPVQQQVSAVQKTAQEHTTSLQEQKASIGDLDRNVAKVSEAAMEADKKAAAAAQSAERAQQSANQAQTAATSATSLAQQSMARAGDLERRIENLDNYKLVTTEKVYFGINRSELTKAEKEKLDQAVQSVQNMRNYVIEIAGYTDRTGSKAANLELSRKRADAVVRYLTVQHNVPLRKIHDVGAGSDFPDADNRTRAARKENRRVDVRIYTIEQSGQRQTSSLNP